ncbi:MAG: pseudouridine synthase [Candidatus Paceibacterota bacterium]|jgi:23S rRNA pseudouridine2604 synthase
MSEGEIRINKYLATQGVSTRKNADKLILAGKVLINGRKAVVGDKVREGDKVEISKKIKNDFIYFAYNKPRGVITHSPQKGEKDIVSSIDIKGVFPIGRLDKDSEGLIILTNDGRITDRLLNPIYDHDKEYVVKTRVPVKPFQLKAMEKGMDLEGIQTKPCKTKLLNEFSFSITISEGQKHQIRRMCDALTLPIESLKRVRIMNIRLGNLNSNEYRKIEDVELKDFLKSLSL